MLAARPSVTRRLAVRAHFARMECHAELEPRRGFSRLASLLSRRQTTIYAIRGRVEAVAVRDGASFRSPTLFAHGHHAPLTRLDLVFIREEPFVDNS